MQKSRIRRIVVHNTENANALSDKVSAFHVQVIERRLNKLPLTVGQKLAVVDKIIENLKLREVDGIIK